MRHLQLSSQQTTSSTWVSSARISHLTSKASWSIWKSRSSFSRTTRSCKTRNSMRKTHSSKWLIRSPMRNRLAKAISTALEKVFAISHTIRSHGRHKIPLRPPRTSACPTLDPCAGAAVIHFTAVQFAAGAHHSIKMSHRKSVKHPRTSNNSQPRCSIQLISWTSSHQWANSKTSWPITSKPSARTPKFSLQVSPQANPSTWNSSRKSSQTTSISSSTIIQTSIQLSYPTKCKHSINSNRITSPMS